MSATKRDSALARGSIAIELSNWLDEELHLPASDVPAYERGLGQPGDNGSTAQRLRLEWEMGYSKVRNVIHLLEAHGVRIFSLPEHLVDVDAFSFWWNGTPTCCSTLGSPPSEAASMPRTSWASSSCTSPTTCRQAREHEWEASRFAVARLMPEADVLASGLRNASVGRILEAKTRWGVFVMALTHRLHELGVISDWSYTSACRRLTQLGYRGGEPDKKPSLRESSQVLEKAFALLRQHGLSATTIAKDLSIHPEALHELVFGLVLAPVAGGNSGSGRREAAGLTVIQGG